MNIKLKWRKEKKNMKREQYKGLPDNIYLRDVLRLERFGRARALLGTIEKVNELLPTLIPMVEEVRSKFQKEGLMDIHGSFTKEFNSKHKNPLIAQAALYVEKTFDEMK